MDAIAKQRQTMGSSGHSRYLVQKLKTRVDYLVHLISDSRDLMNILLQSNCLLALD